MVLDSLKGSAICRTYMQVYGHLNREFIAELYLISFDHPVSQRLYLVSWSPSRSTLLIAPLTLHRHESTLVYLHSHSSHDDNGDSDCGDEHVSLHITRFKRGPYTIHIIWNTTVQRSVLGPAGYRNTVWWGLFMTPPWLTIYRHKEAQLAWFIVCRLAVPTLGSSLFCRDREYREHQMESNINQGNTTWQCFGREDEEE